MLGVSHDSEDVVIQAAYRALMRRYHPDRNPSKEAAQRSIEINRAYSVLGDARSRASYDASRNSKHRAGAERRPKNEGSKSPPSPPPPNDGKSQTQPDGNRQVRPASPWRAALTVLGVLAVIAIFTAVSVLNSRSVDQTTAGVDATTDMNAADANMTMNASDLNATVPATEARDLSNQPETAVDYSTIEDAAKAFARLLTKRGLSGARAYSESCHKVVQSKPSWNRADSCAAFDFAAAYIDDGITNQTGWSKDAYFQFQRSNQADNYEAVGASSLAIESRLSKIREAAENAGLDAMRIQLARQRASPTTADPATGSAGPMSDSSNITMNADN